MERYRYFINYRVLNFLVFIALVFSVQQAKLFTIERFYTVLMVFCSVFLFGLISKSSYINRIAHAISLLFDEKDIDFYNKAAKTISIATSILLISLLPMLLIVEKSNAYYAFQIIVLVYVFSYALLISYIIVSTKSFFYHYLQGNAATISSKDNVNTYHLPIFKSSPLVDSSNNQFREVEYEIINNDYKPEIHGITAVLKYIFPPKSITNYVPLFVIIDKLYITRDVENDILSRELHALIARLSDGNQGSIKRRFNSVINDESYKDKVEPIKKALYGYGKNPIKNLEKFKGVANRLLEAFNSSYFEIPKEKSDEFVILCVLYFSIFVDRNDYPDITDLIKEVNCRPSLLKGLKKILD